MRSNPALLLVLLLLAGLCLVPAGRALAEDPAGPTDAERASVRQMVEELREEASRIRGLAWRFHVPADFLSRDQLRANLMEMVKEELKPEELERDTRIARRLGMLGPDEDPLSMMLEMLKEMVAGYYNPKSRKLFLIEGMAGDGQRPVILHELIHALEDQYVDLDSRTKRWEDDPDRIFAEQCIAEGSAEHGRKLYQKEHPEVTKAYLKGQQDPAMMKRQIQILRKIPAWMMVSTLLHYDVGPKLVEQYVGDDYAGGMARLYAYSPETQEHFLHPKRWLGEKQDYPERIEFVEDLAERAGDGWKTLHELTSGELDLALYLDFFLGKTKGKLNLFLMMQGKYYVPRAAKAAEGWDGALDLFLEKDGEDIAWIQALAFDTVEDATEAVEALRDAIDASSGRTFEAMGDATEDVPSLGFFQRTIDYRTRHGRGRLFQDGTHVYGVDGVSDETLEKLWPAVLETTFEKDPRDTWSQDAPEAPVAPAAPAAPAEKKVASGTSPAKTALNHVSETAGVGVLLPDGWTKTDPTQPMAALAMSRGEIVGELTAQAVPGEIDLEALAPMIEAQFKASVPNFDPAARVEVEVGGQPGYRYDIVVEGPGTAGNAGSAAGKVAIAAYVGHAKSRLLVLSFHGPADQVKSHLEEMDRIAAGIDEPGDS